MLLTSLYSLAYQAEIDNITKRTKFSESSFLSIYKLLADAPDPAPLFEAAIVISLFIQTDKKKSNLCVL